MADAPFYWARYVSLPTDERPAVHGSVICELPGGAALAGWYAGPREGDPDGAVMGGRLTKEEAGKAKGKWEELGVWADVPDRTLGNPVLFAEPGSERIWLFYIVLYAPKWYSGKIHYRHSTDGGATWGPEQTFEEELGHMTRNKLYVGPSGEWLLPLYDERDWSSYVAMSRDGGKTWERS